MQAGFFILSVITALILRYKQIIIRPYAIIIPDALALGLYSAIGAAYAMELHVSWFIAILMGTITATFGGVMRDICATRCRIYSSMAARFMPHARSALRLFMFWSNWQPTIMLLLQQQALL